MFLTQKHLHRRTFLKGMGASVALPFLDAMAPAGRPWTDAMSESDRTRFVGIEMVLGRLERVGGAAEPLVSCRDRPELRFVSQQLEPARAVPGLPDDREQHGRPDGGGVRAEGDRG